MAEKNRTTRAGTVMTPFRSVPRRMEKRRRLTAALVGIGAVALGSAGAAAWLGLKASTINDELQAATQLAVPLKGQIKDNNIDAAAFTVGRIQSHTAVAKDAVSDPVWMLASSLPWAGVNFSAVSEMARSADDVANLGLAPLVSVYKTLDWNKLLPAAEGADLEPLKSASPKIISATHAVRASAERLHQVDDAALLPQVAEPLLRARAELDGVSGALGAAADASRIAPGMLGADGPRSYLLMIQNNAEARASGGIPGALAVLSIDGGKLSLTAQSSAGDVGVMAPPLPLDAEQQNIYSVRLGKFMQDVNLTPDFPSAAATARAMWEQKMGHSVDGVISIDPVTLSYILDATGPLTLNDPALIAIGSALPQELTGSNVVQLLLSDVYAKIQPTKLQDAYFAGVAQEIFAALSEGKGDAKALFEALGRGTAENRVLLWSASPQEQSTLAQYPLSGSISGPGNSPAQFGVYFNDGTGAKMDYYVKRTVQLVKECPRDGYEETTVRIISTNTAPFDAATALPAYVTGKGHFGVPPGSVQTNIVVYGPVQANVETAKTNGQKTEFAPYFHSSRPVGVLAIRLAPGESRTVEFTFGKIVQHAEPNVVVTPSVQAVKDVILPTETATCG